MSFYPQPYKYQCGPFALKYALVMLGKFEDEKEISIKAGSTWWYGTDEIGLEKAAKSFNCQMLYFKSSSKEDALNLLIKYLKKGHPCILSVDNWGHWLTVGNEQDGKFIVVDSGLEKVIKIYSYRQLLKRWEYPDDNTSEVSYDGYALYSQDKEIARANFSLTKAKYVMRERNRHLAENWDTYFNDLIAICKPKNPLSKKIISFGEFLRRNEKLLIQQILYWHGKPNKAEIKKILSNFQFVAEVYNLVIRKEEQKKALVDLSAILMMYACGKYGMKKIY